MYLFSLQYIKNFVGAIYTIIDGLKNMFLSLLLVLLSMSNEFGYRCYNNNVVPF